jgi:transcriptional regulator with XRE-family HTH domain
MSNRTNKDINERVGLQLREAREKAKITQKELAEYIKIGKNHIHQVETGKSKASVEILLGYCDRLGLTPNEILEFGMGDISSKLVPRISSMTLSDQEKLAQVLDLIYRAKKE